MKQAQGRHRFALRGLFIGLSLAGALRAQGYESSLLDGVAARDRALETNSERDWQRALQHFAHAVELEPTKEAQFELAEAAAHLGLVALAYGAYEAALALGLQGKARARAQEYLAAQQAHVARLEVLGPSGASVWVEDQPRGQLPLPRPLAVSPGELRVRLEQTGFESQELRVHASAATLERVQITLAPRAVSAVVAPMAVPPLTGVPAPEALAASPPAWATPTLIAGSTLAVLGLGTLTVSSLLLPDARQDLAALCAMPDPRDGDHCVATAPAQQADAQKAANRIVTLENLRWVGVAGAAVGLTAGAIGLLRLLASDAPEPAGAALDGSPERLSLVWSGRF